MSNAQAAGATRESSVGNKGTLFAEMAAFDVGGGIKHFLHARTALGTFVGDDDAIARLHLTSENALTSVVLRIEDHGWTFEMPQFGSHTGCFHHTTILGDVAKEHCQTTVFRIGVFHIAYASRSTIGVKTGPLLILIAHLGGETATGGTVVDAVGLSIDRRTSHCLVERQSINALGVATYQSALVQLVQNAQDATSSVALLD